MYCLPRSSSPGSTCHCPGTPTGQTSGPRLAWTLCRLMGAVPTPLLATLQVLLQKKARWFQVNLSYSGPRLISELERSRNLKNWKHRMQNCHDSGSKIEPIYEVQDTGSESGGPDTPNSVEGKCTLPSHGPILVDEWLRTTVTFYIRFHERRPPLPARHPVLVHT